MHLIKLRLRIDYPQTARIYKSIFTTRYISICYESTVNRNSQEVLRALYFRGKLYFVIPAKCKTIGNPTARFMSDFPIIFSLTELLTGAFMMKTIPYGGKRYFDPRTFGRCEYHGKTYLIHEYHKISANKCHSCGAPFPGLLPMIVHGRLICMLR